MALEQDQKNFIMTKVKELGSVPAVVKLYNKDCAVDTWAITYAKLIFSKKEKKK